MGPDDDDTDVADVFAVAVPLHHVKQRMGGFTLHWDLDSWNFFFCHSRAAQGPGGENHSQDRPGLPLVTKGDLVGLFLESPHREQVRISFQQANSHFGTKFNGCSGSNAVSRFVASTVE